jgi:hypothetical protein
MKNLANDPKYEIQIKHNNANIFRKWPKYQITDLNSLSDKFKKDPKRQI